MKFERTGENAFSGVMEPGDASETEIAYNIDQIALLSAHMADHGFTPEIRARDRANYYRYAECERSLMLIASSAQAALLHIKLLDFPEAPGEPPDRLKQN